MTEGLTASFKVLERDVQSTDILFKKDTKMKEIFARFANKMFSDLYDFEFYYKDKKIENDSDLTVNKLIGNNNSNNIEIKVFKRSKIIKCPKCICNNCVIKVENYKLHFTNCFHHGNQHEDSVNILDYDKTQKIDFSQIRCDESRCNKNQNTELNDFNKCLECSKALDHARYYCGEHSNSHFHKGDCMIKYNEKYFYCTEHFKKFICYCSTHKLNLCKDCIEGHKKVCNSKIIKFTSSLNLTAIKNQLEDIQKKTETLKHLIVDEIQKMMNRSIEMIEKYKYIAYDIIAKYELNNNNTDLKNYQIIKNIKNLKISNKEIIEDLDGLLKQNSADQRQNWISKCSKLIDIYYCYREHYENKNKEIDEDEDEKSLSNEIEEEEDKESTNEDKKRIRIQNQGTKNGGQPNKKITVAQDEKACGCKRKLAIKDKNQG